MRALGVVELQRPGERLQHALGDAADVAALEALVVVDAHAGERRDLLAAQARHPPRAVGRQSGLLRRDLRPPRGQELGDVVGVSTVATTVRRCVARLRVPCRYPSHRAFPRPRTVRLSGAHACSHLQRAPLDQRRRPARSGHHRADRRDRPRRPGLRLRLGPLVLPRRLAVRARPDRPRVHRRRRGRRRRRLERRSAATWSSPRSPSATAPARTARTASPPPA